MTTIVYKDGVLVADSQVTCGNKVTGISNKIASNQDIFAGASGSYVTMKNFLRLVESGSDFSEIIEYVNDELINLDSDSNCTTFIVVDRGTGTVWLGDTREGIVQAEKNDYYAIGTGEDFALGAMEAGADAVRALEVAAKLDIYTSLPMKIMEL